MFILITAKYSIIPQNVTSTKAIRSHTDACPVKHTPHMPKGLLSHSGSLKISLAYQFSTSGIRIREKA